MGAAGILRHEERTDGGAVVTRAKKERTVFFLYQSAANCPKAFRFVHRPRVVYTASVGLSHRYRRDVQGRTDARHRAEDGTHRCNRGWSRTAGESKTCAKKTSKKKGAVLSFFQSSRIATIGELALAIYSTRTTQTHTTHTTHTHTRMHARTQFFFF